MVPSGRRVEGLTGMLTFVAAPVGHHVFSGHSIGRFSSLGSCGSSPAVPEGQKWPAKTRSTFKGWGVQCEAVSGGGVQMAKCHTAMVTQHQRSRRACCAGAEL